MSHSTVDAALWTENLNLLNKVCFYRNNMWCQKLQQVFEVSVVFWPWHRSTYSHSTVDAALWTENLNLLNKVCFYRNNMWCQKLQQVFEVSVVFWPWHRSTIILPLVYCCPVDNTLFKVSTEIRCSAVSCCYCCYENHTAGSKPIWKLFTHHWRTE